MYAYKTTTSYNNKQFNHSKSSYIYFFQIICTSPSAAIECVIKLHNYSEFKRKGPRGGL